MCRRPCTSLYWSEARADHAALPMPMCLSQCAQGDSGKRLKYHLLGGGGGGAASNAAQPPASGPPVRLTHAGHCCLAYTTLDPGPCVWPLSARERDNGSASMCEVHGTMCDASLREKLESSADGTFTLGAHTGWTLVQPSAWTLSHHATSSWLSWPISSIPSVAAVCDRRRRPAAAAAARRGAPAAAWTRCRATCGT